MEPHLIWTDLFPGLNFVLKHYGLQTVLHWKWEHSFEYRRITGAEIIKLWGAAIISPLLTLFTHSIKTQCRGVFCSTCKKHCRPSSFVTIDLGGGGISYDSFYYNTSDENKQKTWHRAPCLEFHFKMFLCQIQLFTDKTTCCKSVYEMLGIHFLPISRPSAWEGDNFKDVWCLYYYSVQMLCNILCYCCFDPKK